MASTTPARNGHDYAMRLSARAAAEGAGAYDRMMLAMEHAFSLVADRMNAKEELRKRLSSDWSDTTTRMRFGWFFRDIESGHLSIDQVLTVLDHWDRTWEREWRLRRYHWHRAAPRLDRKQTLRMRMLLRWLRRRHQYQWTAIVERMATPAGFAPVVTMEAAE